MRDVAGRLKGGQYPGLVRESSTPTSRLVPRLKVCRQFALCVKIRCSRHYKTYKKRGPSGRLSVEHIGGVLLRILYLGQVLLNPVPLITSIVSYSKSAEASISEKLHIFISKRDKKIHFSGPRSAPRPCREGRRRAPCRAWS